MTSGNLREIVDNPVVRSSVAAVDLVQLFIDRILTLDQHFGAIFSLTPAVTAADASRVDEARGRGTPLPLDGMPIVVKDNIDVQSSPTTAGARFHLDNYPRADAGVVARIRRAGGIVLGKAAMHELAFGVTCDGGAFPATRNPWDVRRIPGGSSGGSAAALAADLCVGAVGSDTGGSVRVPAALTGVTGMRPSTGVIGTDGLLATCPSFDTIGPMARSARDVGALFGVMRSLKRRSGNQTRELFTREDLSGVRVGIPEEFCGREVDRTIASRVYAAGQILETLGARVMTIQLANFGPVREQFATAVRAEAFSQHAARLNADPGAFGVEVRRRLELGRDVDSNTLQAAWLALDLWCSAVLPIFDDFDLLLSPTTPDTAPFAGGTEMTATTEHLTALTAPWSVLGLPSISVPCGVDMDGLPIGMQICAPQQADDAAIHAAICYQLVTDFHRLRPPPPSADTTTARAQLGPTSVDRSDSPT